MLNADTRPGQQWHDMLLQMKTELYLVVHQSVQCSAVYYTAEKARRKECFDAAIMGSLALSADSASRSQNPFRRASQGRTSTVGSTANSSNLIGLELLDNSRSTYEL
jgi:hypothetical protein